MSTVCVCVCVQSTKSYEHLQCKSINTTTITTDLIDRTIIGITVAAYPSAYPCIILFFFLIDVRMINVYKFYWRLIGPQFLFINHYEIVKWLTVNVFFVDIKQLGIFMKSFPRCVCISSSLTPCEYFLQCPIHLMI